MSGAITDVAGIRVGQVQRIGDGWLTGVTVVVPPEGSLAAVSVRGAAPATHQTDALHAGAVAPSPQAIVLTGGSSYGLISAHGVARRLAEEDRGYRVGDEAGQVIPLVPAAAIYDVGRGGRFDATPTIELGYEAASQALAQPLGGEVARGTVGAGTGAALLDERYKGGVGTASRVLRLDGTEIRVGALAVVNAFGGPVENAVELADDGGLPHPGFPPASTVLVVLATDAELDLGVLRQTADQAHDALARTLDPVHTVADGDTIFAVTTREITVPGAEERFGSPRRWRDAMIGLQAGATRVVQAAIRDAVRSATGVSTPSFELPKYPLR